MDFVSVDLRAVLCEFLWNIAGLSGLGEWILGLSLGIRGCREL